MKKIIAVIAMLYTGTVLAGEAAKQIEGPIGARIIAAAPSTDPAFTAILAEKDGKRRLFYETADGRHLIYGLVFDSNGTALTAIDTANLEASLAKGVKPQAPQPAQAVAPDLNAAWNLATKAKAIVKGKGAPVYIVFDPNCPFCKQLYRKVGDVANREIHWIPVGVLNDNSSAKAYALLNGKVSMDEMAASVASALPITQDQEKTLNPGIYVMLAAKTTSVPLVIYDDGGRKKAINGLPNDAEIAAIFGRK